MHLHGGFFVAMHPKNSSIKVAGVAGAETDPYESLIGMAVGGFLLVLVLLIAVTVLPVVAVIAILYSSLFAFFLPPLESGIQQPLWMTLPRVNSKRYLTICVPIPPALEVKPLKMKMVQQAHKPFCMSM